MMMMQAQCFPVAMIMTTKSYLTLYITLHPKNPERMIISAGDDTDEEDDNFCENDYHLQS